MSAQFSTPVSSPKLATPSAPVRPTAASDVSTGNNTTPKVARTMKVRVLFDSLVETATATPSTSVAAPQTPRAPRRSTCSKPDSATPKRNRISRGPVDLFAAAAPAAAPTTPTTPTSTAKTTTPKAPRRLSYGVQKTVGTSPLSRRDARKDARTPTKETVKVVVPAAPRRQSTGCPNRPVVAATTPTRFSKVKSTGSIRSSLIKRRMSL